jgi:site-specific DNA-cytosine methylase
MHMLSSVCTGPPCQGFSVMNNMRYVLSQNDVFKDKRNRLIKVSALFSV